MKTTIKFGVVALATFCLSCGAADDKKKKESTPAGAGSGAADSVVLKWLPPPAEEELQDYRIYVAPSAGAPGQLLETVKATAPGFDPTKPERVLTIAQFSDLKQLIGKEACFHVTATVDGQETEPTKTVCATL